MRPLTFLTDFEAL